MRLKVAIPLSNESRLFHSIIRVESAPGKEKVEIKWPAIGDIYYGLNVAMGSSETGERTQFLAARLDHA